MHPERASCVYTGTVMHRRLGPAAHEFRYRISLLGLDLAEVAHLGGLAPLWGYERRAPISLWRGDCLGDAEVPLDESVRALVAARSGCRPGGPIHLVTAPRVLGYSFNPISLYLCYDEGGRDLECIVAEVTNTPWLERHCYVLAIPPHERGRTVHRFATPKEMHVSPFLGMRQTYHWRIAIEGERLSVAIVADTAGKRLFAATMELVARPLARASLLRCLLDPPLGSIGTTAAIYTQALRLWWKGARYHPHPRDSAPPEGARIAPLRPPHAPAEPGQGEQHGNRAHAA